MPRDLGEPLPINDPTWIADDGMLNNFIHIHFYIEPPTIPCDSWSRGSVPVKPKPPPDPLSARSHMSSTSKLSTVRKPSKAAELRQMEAPKRHQQQQHNQQQNQQTQQQPQQPQATDPTNPNANVNGRRSNLGATNTSNNATVNHSFINTNLKKKKKEVVKLTPQEEENLKRQQEEAEEKQRLEKLKFSLRGKDYTYDSNGEIIIINKLDASRLPTSTIKLKFNINASVSDSTGLVGESPNTTPDTVAAKKKSKPTTTAKKKPNTSQFITETTPSYPMVDKLKPSQGVTFKDGKKVVKGAPMEIEKSMMKSTRQKQEKKKIVQDLQPSLGLPFLKKTNEETKNVAIREPVPQQSSNSVITNDNVPRRGLNLNKRESVAETNILSIEENHDEEDDEEEQPKPLAPQAPATVWDRNRKHGGLKNNSRTRHIPHHPRQQRINGMTIVEQTQPLTLPSTSTDEDEEGENERQPTQVGLTTRRDLPSVSTVENTDLYYAFLQSIQK
jgi:hypothetical protein